MKTLRLGVAAWTASAYVPTVYICFIFGRFSPSRPYFKELEGFSTGFSHLYFVGNQSASERIQSTGTKYIRTA